MPTGDSTALTRSETHIATTVATLALMVAFLAAKTTAVISLIRALSAPDAAGALLNTAVFLAATPVAVGLVWLLGHAVNALDAIE